MYVVVINNENAYDWYLPTDILGGSFCPLMVTTSDGSDRTC